MSVVIVADGHPCLAEAVESLLEQTIPPHEVIVVRPSDSPLPDRMPHAPPIRVVEDTGASTLGALRRLGFEAASGEVLVDMEPEDLLLPGALEALREAFGRTTAGFAYGNGAAVRLDDGSALTPDPGFGWRSRPIEVGGRALVEARAFPPSAASISRAWSAPTFVRAWRRSSYFGVGGHNPELDGEADLDVVIRTYLGARAQHLDTCLCLRREHPDRRAHRDLDRMAAAGAHLYHQNLDALVLRWATENRHPCYDLGEIQNPAPGWITVDMDGRAMQVDLRGRWPWGDSTVGAFRANDFLNLLPDRMHTMAEIHRCLVPGGWLLSATPSALGEGGFMNPLATSYWVRSTFRNWTERGYAERIRNETVRFIAMRLQDGYPSEFHQREGVSYVLFDGLCLKEGYEGPGLREI